MLRRLIKILSFAAVVTVYGCGSAPTERMADVNPVLWTPEEQATVMFENNDTTGLLALDILLMFNERLMDRQLGLRITAVAPDSTYFTEDITVMLDVQHQKENSYHEVSLPYRDSVILSRQGTYAFNILPLRDVEGMRSVGINFRDR